MWIMGKSETCRATRRRPPPKNARDRAVLVFAPLRRAQPVAPRTRRRESPVRHGRHPPLPHRLRQQPQREDQEGWCAPHTPPIDSPNPRHPPAGGHARAIFQPRRFPTPPPRALRHDRSTPPPATYSPPTPLHPPPPRRAEEVLGRGLLPVRQGDRRGRRQDVQAPRPSVGGFRQRRVRHRRRPRPSGFPLLR